MGPDATRENSPQYIDDALSKGFDCEIDLWVLDGETKLGHDYGHYSIELSWLRDRREKLWIHCKNREAVARVAVDNFNWFFHDSDSYTLTSTGYIWCYPGEPAVGPRSIILDFGRADPTGKLEISDAYGVCGDFIGGWGRAPGFASPSAH